MECGKGWCVLLPLSGRLCKQTRKIPRERNALGAGHPASGSRRKFTEDWRELQIMGLQGSRGG